MALAVELVCGRRFDMVHMSFPGNNRKDERFLLVRALHSLARERFERDSKKIPKPRGRDTEYENDVSRHQNWTVVGLG